MSQEALNILAPPAAPHIVHTLILDLRCDTREGSRLPEVLASAHRAEILRHLAERSSRVSEFSDVLQRV